MWLCGYDLRRMNRPGGMDQVCRWQCFFKGPTSLDRSQHGHRWAHIREVKKCWNILKRQGMSDYLKRGREASNSRGLMTPCCSHAAHMGEETLIFHKHLRKPYGGVVRTFLWQSGESAGTAASQIPANWFELGTCRDTWVCRFSSCLCMFPGTPKIKGSDRDGGCKDKALPQS